MLGAKAKQFKPHIAVSLDRLVPEDNFYRQVEAKLDLSFVRELVKDCYAGTLGRPSIDPVVFFKLQLIMFFEGIRSERQLMEMVNLNLAHRWYLGYDLDEAVPDHSSLSKIRSRFGLGVFQRFFERIVELCMEAGLVWGRELYFDGTRVRANAALDSTVPRWYWQAKQHVNALFPEEPSRETVPTEESASSIADHSAPDACTRVETDAPTEGTPADAGTCKRNSLRLVTSSSEETPAAARSGLTRRPLGPGGLVAKYDGTRIIGQRQVSYKRLADSKVSPTDPDASQMSRFTGDRAKLGYHTHYVVDGGKVRIILAALVTPASIMDNTPMLDLERWARFRWRLKPELAVGDTRYGTTANIVGLEADGIRAYVPLPDWSSRTSFYPAQAFEYDPEHDLYRCPQGQELPLRVRRQTEEVNVYQGKAETCNACPVKADCTKSSSGRHIFRSFYQDALDRVAGYHQTEAYKKAMRKRQVWVEPLFGEGKQWHGMAYFRLRGLLKVNIEGVMRAAGQNIKRLLSHEGRRKPEKPVSWAVIPSFRSVAYTSRRAKPTLDADFFNSLCRYTKLSLSYFVRCEKMRII